MKSFSGPKPLQLYRLYQTAKIIGTITNPRNKTIGGTSSTVSSTRLRTTRRDRGGRAPALWVRAISGRSHCLRS
jgi:hypothetical protein